MITTLFRKSTVLNYSIVIIGVVVFFFLFQIQVFSTQESSLEFLKKGVLFAIILTSIFTSNFIIIKNGLSKDSAYTVLAYFILLLFSPTLWNNFHLIVSNFFVLLALRRLISLQSLKFTKEKIFDASLWVFVASLFHFWSILYIILVFIAILFQAARDYRNWFLPIIAFFTTASIFGSLSLFFDKRWITHFISLSVVDYKINYFVNNYQNLALSVYATIALFFLISMFMSISKKPLNLHSSFKKIIWAFIIGVIIFIVSPNKSNDMLVFTIAPLSMMITNHIEMSHIKWQKEVVLAILIIAGLFAFISQL